MSDALLPVHWSVYEQSGMIGRCESCREQERLPVPALRRHPTHHGRLSEIVGLRSMRHLNQFAYDMSCLGEALLMPSHWRRQRREGGRRLVRLNVSLNMLDMGRSGLGREVGRGMDNRRMTESRMRRNSLLAWEEKLMIARHAVRRQWLVDVLISNRLGGRRDWGPSKQRSRPPIEEASRLGLLFGALPGTGRG